MLHAHILERLNRDHVKSVIQEADIISFPYTVLYGIVRKT